VKLTKRRFQNLQNLKEKTRAEIGERKFGTETEARTEAQNSEIETEVETEAQNSEIETEAETEAQNSEIGTEVEMEAQNSEIETEARKAASSCQALGVRKVGRLKNCPTLWRGSDVRKGKEKEGTKPAGLGRS